MSESPKPNKAVYDESQIIAAYREIFAGLSKIYVSADEQRWDTALSKGSLSMITLWDIYNYFSKTRANELLSIDIDPDLILQPEYRLIYLVDGHTFRLFVGNPSKELEAILKKLPGIVHSSKETRLWQSSASADELRESLRDLLSTHGFKITSEAVSSLRTEAKEKVGAPTATAPAVKVTPIKATVKPVVAAKPAFVRSETPVGLLSLDPEKRPLIRFTKSEPEIADQLKRVSGFAWNANENAFRAPASRLKEIVVIAREYNIALAPDAEAELASYNAPFIYDGTFNGLRGVPLTDLFCIDDTKAKRFTEFGIENIWDLLNLIPYRYLDRSNPVLIANLVPGQETGLVATITNIDVDHRRRMLKLTASDGTGKLGLTYFNAVWMAKRYRVGDEVAIYGRVEEWRANSGRSFKSMTNPIVDPLGESTVPIIPIYPQSGKARVSTWDLHAAVFESLARLGELLDSIPVTVREKYKLIDRVDALRAVHLPATMDSVEVGRTRLAFDELFRMQLALLSLKAQEESEEGIVHKPTGELTGALLTGLPFELTGAQQRVIGEIKEGMIKPTSSRIMVQADVGAGKTLVAVSSMLSAIEGGYQAALLGPTGLLATQLFLETCERTEGILVNGKPIRIEFFDNKLRVKQRREILAELASGNIHIIVGTHSLLSDDVEFKNLGFVVVDEQQKWGTLQRSVLTETKGPIYTVNGVEKRARPDLLLMSATPIPRSAAMVFFGDLQMATIDMLPPGRIPVKTEFINLEIDLIDQKVSPWKEVRLEVEKGFQAYVICALVEENEKLELASVKETFEGLSNGALAGLRVAMVYGKQDPEERKGIMDSYKRGEIDVLIGSSVLEVGISVARATVMVILDPTRFGLATLHQSRGRVGRSTFPSRCFLYGRAVSSDAYERMKALVESNDGFKISEKDLELRGAGTIFGASQSGASDLRVADLFRDKHLIEMAREAASGIIETDPMLERRPGLKSEVAHMLGEGAEEWLVKT